MRLGILIIVLFLGLAAGCSWYWYRQSSPVQFLNPAGEVIASPSPKPLLRYTFDSLTQQSFLASDVSFQIEQDSLTVNSTDDPEKSKRYLFYYSYEGKRISGLAQFPKAVTVPVLLPFNVSQFQQDSRVNEEEVFPVIIMLRGYVDKENYRTGVGTERAGKILAENGFITLAPDFLGYGQSDPEPIDAWESRFSNPAQVLTLLASVSKFPQADANRVGIWAHSNGGQIALSVLEISQQPYPTTFWAPVSKPFPYSVLYFTDEFEDEGKYLRSEIAKLEKDYDVRDYSITDYLDRVQAPMVLHQGTIDDAVPLRWSNQLVEKLKDLGKEVTYYVYPGADHNLAGSWNIVVERDVAFFKKQFAAD